MIIEATLEKKLNEYRDDLINQIILKNCSNVEFIRGQLNLIDHIFNNPDIDKTAIVTSKKSYFV